MTEQRQPGWRRRISEFKCAPASNPFVGIEAKPRQGQQKTGASDTVEDSLPSQSRENECSNRGRQCESHLVSCKSDRDNPCTFVNTKSTRNRGCSCGDQ